MTRLVHFLLHLLLVLGLSQHAFASDMLRCDPADLTVPNRVVEYQRSANTEEAWLTDPTRIVNPSSLPPGSSTYWKCSAGSVVAMSPAERDAIDAPAVAAAALQQTYTDEIVSNNLCTATLAEVTTRVDNLRDIFNAGVETDRLAFNSSVDAAAGNVAAMKVLLKNLNDQTAQGLTAVENDLAVVAKKTARCMKARLQ